MTFLFPELPIADGPGPYWAVIAHWTDGTRSTQYRESGTVLDHDDAAEVVRALILDPLCAGIEVTCVAWWWHSDFLPEVPDVPPDP